MLCLRLGKSTQSRVGIALMMKLPAPPPTHLSLLPAREHTLWAWRGCLRAVPQPTPQYILEEVGGLEEGL